MIGNDLSIFSMFKIFEALVEIALDSDTSAHIREIRLDAVGQLPSYLSSYTKSGLNPDVIELVCHKKLEFIRKANTNAEIRAIMSAPRPRWYAGKIICESPYHIDAEELLIWSHFSPGNLVPPEAAERALSLFRNVFGCPVSNYKGGKPLG